MKIYQIAFWLVIIILCGCNHEKSLIEKAREINTAKSYKEYLMQYEQGEYSTEAINKIAQFRFEFKRDSAFYTLINCLNKHIEDNRAKIEIYPSNKILMGTPIEIKISQLQPNQIVTIHAYRRRWKNLLYSFATFTANENGSIQLSDFEPLNGTYTGNDPLGIFWSMSQPAKNDSLLPFNIQDLENNTIYLHLVSENKIIASNTLQLIDKLQHIKSEKIHNDSLVALFHYPENKTNLPLLILLSGSEGGYNNINKMAKIISSHGFAVLALAYFKIDPLPRFLEEIELNYFFKALDWIKRKPMIDSTKIIMAGGSRGGELALLLASLRKDIKGVIAVEPSCVLWQGLPHSFWTVFFPNPAWLLNGEELSYLDHNLHLPTLAKFGSNDIQIELMRLYEGILDDNSEIEEALIKVENIQGPILLIAGKDGKVWPAHKMCKMMESRLYNAGFPFPVHGQYYDNAGHYVTITPELLPTINYKYEQLMVGGTDSGNAHAQIHSWNKIIEFLNKYFSNRT